ncbi:hypothetical protein [Parvibaculum sp.]|uniref:hypothetical protein n=1 Tax=Parvibaculum sp. TaxID=2024848 RepID=UPI00391B2059
MNGLIRHGCADGTSGIHGRLRPFVVVCLAFLFLALPLSAKASGDVRTDFREEDGYGRLVFTFSGGVPSYRASINAGVLVLEFGRSVPVDSEAFLRAMPRYVALVRQPDDRRSVRAALTTDFKLDTKSAENALYVDLLPPGWTGAPPPLPADVLARIEESRQAKKAAEEAKLAAKAQGIVEPEAPPPALAVRVASRSGMTRIVFDWNQPVLYSLVNREGLATITFDRTSKVDLSRIRADLPAYLAGINAVEHDGRLSVVMTLKPGVAVSDFREDLGIVVDLKPHHATLAPSPEKEEAGPRKIVPVSEEDTASAAAPVTADAETEAAASDGTAASETSGENADVPVTVGPVPEGKRPEGKAVVRFAEGRNGMDLLVDWPEPVGAAVFERADRLWIVFDRDLPLDMDKLVTPDPAESPYGMPEAIKISEGAALSIPLRAKVLIGAVNEGASWRISAGETIPTTGRPIAISRKWREDGRGMVEFDLRTPRKVVRLRDPIVGDEIIAVTAAGPGQAMQMPRSFVEFQALRTAQGLAIVPVADDLNVAAAPDSVLVMRQDGLTLSADDNREWRDGDEAPVVEQTAPAEMRFAEWRDAPGETFFERRQYYLAQLSDARTHEVGDLRFAYGRFLLAYGLAQEARAMFLAARQADSRLATEPAFRVALGVSSVLSGRHVEAIRELSGTGLDNSPHAAAWRGLARASLGHWEEAKSQFALAGAIVDSFGEELQTEFRSLAATAALKTNDIASAEQYAAGFPRDPQSQKARAQVFLVNAMIADLHDRKDKAVDFYDAAIQSRYSPVVARARFGKAQLLHRSGDMDDEAFGKELESLRYAWRGDELELDVLTKLAELRLSEGKVGEALKAMRTATDNYPDSDEAHRMNMRMSDIFADYFLSKSVDDLTPVQALAFFEAFKELTPIGQRGDEMIRDLAERLVKVDLLEQAAHLLDYQVANRLHGGVAKAQVAARLAAIFLTDQKPDRALAALRATRQNLLPEALAERRMLLEARALSDMKQYDHALDLIEGKSGPLFDRLRADTLWAGGRWEEAGPAIEVALGDGWKNEEAPDAEARLLIMRGAIAYSLAQDEEGLARLRIKYGDVMSRSADADAFAVVTEPIVKQGVAFREMASRIASVDTLDRFIASLNIDAEPLVN